MMKKKIKAVQPYIHPGHLNFKLPAYKAWVKNGGKTLPPRYPCRALHGAAYRMELPTLWKSKDTAVLMFVEPVSITFDTFPYYAIHEIIPFIWDCWPRYYDKMEKWLRKHKVKTAIFTSSMEMEEMKQRLPAINYIHYPEAVDSSVYKAGKPLKERCIDLFEFGRSNKLVVSGEWIEGINHVCSKVDGKFVFSDEQLYDAMADTKMTIGLPRSITEPSLTQGVETLTQRFWETMLSRTVIVGHAPKELIDFIGYNPVIEIEDDFKGQVLNILKNIDDYQELVNRNREVALKKGDWRVRIKCVLKELNNIGYKI